jgi:hypothetical protein
MYRIIQSHPVVAILYERGMGRDRQIYLNGHQLPIASFRLWGKKGQLTHVRFAG